MEAILPFQNPLLQAFFEPAHPPGTVTWLHSQQPVINSLGWH